MVSENFLLASLAAVKNLFSLELPLGVQPPLVSSVSGRVSCSYVLKALYNARVYSLSMHKMASFISIDFSFDAQEKRKANSEDDSDTDEQILAQVMAESRAMAQNAVATHESGAGSSSAWSVNCQTVSS